MCCAYCVWRYGDAMYYVITMLCYAMLCYSMFFYAILCYFMLFYAIVCYCMQLYAIVCYCMLLYAIVWYSMLLYAILYYYMLVSCYSMQFCAIICFLCYFMLLYATLCWVNFAWLCHVIVGKVSKYWMQDWLTDLFQISHEVVEAAGASVIKLFSTSLTVGQNKLDFRQFVFVVRSLSTVLGQCYKTFYSRNLQIFVIS